MKPGPPPRLAVGSTVGVGAALEAKLPDCVCDMPRTSAAFLVGRKCLCCFTRSSGAQEGSLIAVWGHFAWVLPPPPAACIGLHGKAAEFQACQGSGAQELCNFNELVAACRLSDPHQLWPGWVPGPAWQAPSILGEAGLRAVGRGGRRVWQTLHTVGRGGQSSTFGASEKPLSGVEEAVPLHVVTPCCFRGSGLGCGTCLCAGEKTGLKVRRTYPAKVTRLVSQRPGNCDPSLPALISVLREAALVTTKIQATFSESESHVASPVNGDTRPGETSLFDRNHLVGWVLVQSEFRGQLLPAPA